MWASTTRNGGTRKATLPPLLPLPLAATTRLQSNARLLKSLCDTLLQLVSSRQLHLPLLPLLLLLPPPQCGLEEVFDSAGVHCLGRSVRQHRRGEERRRGSHVTDRGLLLPAPLAPAGRQGASHLLWRSFWLRCSSHLRRRVVVSFRQSSCDEHPLVSPPRAESWLPPPPRRGGPIAVNFHQVLESTERQHRKGHA